MKAAVLGVGARGAPWAARLALMGADVHLFDRDPAALDRANQALDTARPLLAGLFDAPLPGEGQITMAGSVAAAVADADWITEALPNRLALKRQVIQTAQAHSDAIIASAGGTNIKDLQGCAAVPACVIVAEGQAPEYLLPVVELGTTAANPAGVVARARQVLDRIGMVPVTSQGAGARLRAALQSADALSAPHQVLQLGVGPALLARDDPRLMVALLRATRARYRPQAAPLRQFEALGGPPDLGQTPLVTLAMAVPADWTDYNGHMTESKYLEAFAYATDRFMGAVGIDAAYIDAGMSLFTVETHIRHLVEAHAGQSFRIDTRVLLAEGKKISLWHKMHSADALLATAENLMLHVDLTTRSTCPPAPAVAKTLQELAARHAHLPPPDGAGKAVGQR
ncbi:thioesterase family protein [Aliiroseovarius sp. PTFE2010]|uniref:thioesterase family protein n=1 Tax=Aliiroseovarius sp. PTFE2010 TaxID=3417190 RepID=UPI003CEB93E5